MIWPRLLCLWFLMALTDDQVTQALDYLGSNQPLASRRLTTLPSLSAGGGGPVTPPVTPAGSAVTGTESSATEAGSTVGGPSSGQIAAEGAQGLLKLAKGAVKFLPEDDPSRGNTGGQSLSDQVRSTDLGGFPVGGTPLIREIGAGGAPPSDIFNPDIIGGAADAGGDVAGVASSIAGPAVAGAGIGLSLYEGQYNQAIQQAIEAAAIYAGGALGGIGALFAIPVIESFLPGDITSPFDPAKAAHQIQGDIKDVSTKLPQLSAGVTDPSTLRGMSNEELQQAYTKALTGSQVDLSEAFSRSRFHQHGISHPDFEDAKTAANTLRPVAAFDTAASLDLLAQRGLTPGQVGATGGQFETEGLSFSEILHSLAPYAGLMPKGPANLTAASVFDPRYASQFTTPTADAEQPGGTGAAPLTDPKAMLSSLGFDPGLADTVGPLIAGAKPGAYLDTLRQVFTAMNPAFDQSELGALFARLGSSSGPAEPQTPAPAEVSRAVASPFTPSGPAGALGFASDMLQS